LPLSTRDPHAPAANPSLEIVMTRTPLLSLSLALLTAGHAYAGELTVEPEPFVSVASRAQVQQELKQYINDGVNPWADQYNPVASFRSSTSRAAVTAEFIASRDSAAAFSSEDSGSSYLARSTAPASRRSTELAHAD
jgi:hypothetical protein